MFSKRNQKNSIHLYLIILVMLVILASCSKPVIETPAATQAETAVPTAIATEVAAVPTEVTAAALQITDTGPLQFSPGSTSMQMPGDLQPNTGIRFTVTAAKGQQMSMWLTTEPESIEAPMATLVITDASGTILTTEPEAYWSQVLPADQTYTVEIRSLAEEDILYSFRIEIPAETVDPDFGYVYKPLDIALCQALQQETMTALNREVYLESYAPFLDAVGREAGQGCRLTAVGTGADFENPGSVVNTLINTVGAGWTQQQDYSADGVTGSQAGLYRDMGLMLIKANWKPEMGVVCPADQPLDACGLAPEQKKYTIEIDLAQYTAGFTLQGHWVDASTGFTLDLYQDWKQIYGQHEVVAQNGNKIDSLEASINGWLKGKVATVQFQSSFADQPGTAEITSIDTNTIHWKISSAPAGEYYLPAEATLKATAP